MKITLVGTGYVGLITGACFAEIGHTVTCIDINEEKIELLKSGGCPIYEEGLSELIAKNRELGRISFTTSFAEGVPDASLVFICVDTPPGEYGKANLTNLFAAVRSCAAHASQDAVFVNKSTAPVGTVKKIKELLASIAPEKNIDVASNPEFLAEGSALKDFFEPDRIIVGVQTDHARNLLHEAYAPLTEKGYTYVATIPPSAEMMKYASNTFLAMKLSFINEIADFCELVGADVKEVAYGMGLDARIGTRYMQAGIGYGGSCFGKDVQALAMKGEELGYEFKMVKALIAVNAVRYQLALRKLEKNLGPLKGKKIAVLGLAFKPKTDDVRDAPSQRIIHELLDRGARVACYDPIAIDTFKQAFRRSNELSFGSDAYTAATGADALLILTEWAEFGGLDLEKLKAVMSNGLIVDGRNVLDRIKAERAGFHYEGVGR